MKRVLRAGLHLARLQRRRRRVRQFYAGFVSPGDLCFDIGANKGERTAILLSLGAAVIAVEPQAECVKQIRSLGSSRLTVMECALGADEGEAEIRLATSNTVSSMAQDWIKAVLASGRFDDVEWTRSVPVQVTTLDHLVERFGRPRFCKVDVEGYEAHVLRGLSQPFSLLSFEHTPEFAGSTVACIDYLTNLDEYEFNYSLGESMRLDLGDRWAKTEEMKQLLLSIPNDAFADIYAKQVNVVFPGGGSRSPRPS